MLKEKNLSTNKQVFFDIMTLKERAIEFGKSCEDFFEAFCKGLKFDKILDKLEKILANHQ